MQGLNSYDNLRCKDNVMHPIEHLFKAIYVMQPMTELEKEAERLSKKLHKMFMKATKEKDGVRSYNNRIRYYPTGLVEWDGRNVILQGYASNYEPPEPEEVHSEGQADIDAAAAEVRKERRSKKPYVRPADMGLRENSLLVYAYLRTVRGRKFSVSDDHKYNLENVIKKRDIYNGLEQAEKDLLNRTQASQFGVQFQDVGKRLFDFLTSSIRNGETWIHKDNLNKKFAVPFFFEDELELIEKACEKGKAEYDKNKARSYSYNASLSYYVENELEEFYKSLDWSRKDRPVIDLTGVLKLKNVPHVGTYWDNNSREYVEQVHYYEQVSYEDVLDRVKEQVLAIEDENILTTLAKFGIAFERPAKEEELSDNSITQTA